MANANINTTQHHDHKASTEDNVQNLRSILKAIMFLSEDASESRDISQLAQVGDFYCECLLDNVDDYAMLLKEAQKAPQKAPTKADDDERLSLVYYHAQSEDPDEVELAVASLQGRISRLKADKARGQGGGA